MIVFLVVGRRAIGFIALPWAVMCRNGAGAYSTGKRRKPTWTNKLRGRRRGGCRGLVLGVGVGDKFAPKRRVEKRTAPIVLMAAVAHLLLHSEAVRQRAPRVSPALRTWDPAVYQNNGAVVPFVIG